MSENLLRHETSPYLLQHADNPVAWRPWGPEAFAEAREKRKPILLSIGYAACHWCHVMAHESFEDPEVAAVMNRLFVNVKVDREERPEVDQVYMAALHSLGQQGGWPLTMFLDWNGAPVWGGTYFPRTERFGRPGFLTVLNEVARIFAEEPDRVASNREAIADRLNQAFAARGPGAIDPSIPDAAAERLLSLTDPVHGGIGTAPKFPNAPVFELLWRAGIRTGDVRYRQAVLTVLERMANGGIFDHVGGGFARYTVDRAWLVPHFEKMLYDNGLLLALYAHAYSATGGGLFRRRITETVTWLEREMITESGCYAASLDADSGGGEGRFYVWRPDEIERALGREDAALFCRVYDVTAQGNWEGVSILNRLGRQTVTPEEEERLIRALEQLRLIREERPRPMRDDKVLADWNGLVIAGLVAAAEALSEPDYLDLAVAAYDGVRRTMEREGRLGHAFRNGRLQFPGLSSDHAAMAYAATAFAAATNESRFIKDARRWLDVLDARHRDPAGAFYLTADDAEALVVRPGGPHDDATPNPNAVAAQALLRLSALTGDLSLRERAERVLAALASHIPENVHGTAGLINALDTLARLRHAVIVTGGSDPTPLVARLRAEGDPTLLISVVEDAGALPSAHPAQAMVARDSRPTLYLCTSSECRAPVTEPDAVPALLHER